METNKSKTTLDSLIFILVGFVSLYIIIFGSTTASEDTWRLIGVTSNMLTCFRQGVFSSCPGMWHFPLSQFIPSAIFVSLGLSKERVASALISLNFVAFIASVALFYTAGKRWGDKPVGILLAAIILSGYGLAYSSFSFNEATAFFLVALFVYTCLFEWNWTIIFLSNIAAGITKEIAPPFLLAMGLLAIAINWDKDKLQEQIKLALVLLLGFAASLAVNGAFNLFRYSSFQNIQLLSKAYIVPNVRIWADYFLMLIFSPSGGLLSTWPTWCAFCFVLIVQRIGSLNRYTGRSFVRNLIPIAGFLGLLLVLHIGLARWWAPFGSTAWGPRLTLPYLGGLLLLLCAANKSSLLTISYQLRSNRRRAIIIGCIVGLLSIPHILMVIAPNQVINLSVPSVSNEYSSLTSALGLSFWDLIPHGEGEVLTQSWKYYYLVAREEAWLSGSIYLVEISLLKDPAILLRALLYAMMFPVLFVFAQNNSSAFVAVQKTRPSLITRQAWWSLGVSVLIGTLLFIGAHLRPALSVQWLGYSSTPEEVINKKTSVPNKCGFIQYRLRIRELGLITNISIDPQSIDFPIWSTDLQGGTLPLWVVKTDTVKSLLNTDNGSVRIPIVEPTTLLLYGMRDCGGNQIPQKQKMEVLVRYSDNRIRSTTVFNDYKK